MSPKELADQPFVGFNYSYWFTCTNCGHRIGIPPDAYEGQCTMQASYTHCGCGTPVDISQEHPTLRNPDDVALQDDSVDQLYWYHSSRYERWPDTAAYTAELTQAMAGTHLRGLNPDRIIERKSSLALHLGTYESAIENMFRRLFDQDVGDPSTIRYWLHRVRLQLRHGDLDPHVGHEFPTMFGDIELSEIYARGGRVSRYVNVHEAIGSVSLAVDPKVIQTVATIAIPVAAIAPAETSVAVNAAAVAAAHLARIEPLRPNTAGITAAELNLAGLLAEPRYRNDPHSVRTHSIAKRLRAYEDQYRAIWSELTEVLVAEYLPGVNEQVRRRFLDAVSHGDDPMGYHCRFRTLAGLLVRPADIIAQFDSAPERIVTPPN